MLQAGPEAHQLAIYLGWLMNGVPGGIVAGTLFVLPGFAAIMGLSVLYAAFGQTGLVAALFFGLKAAVLAIVLQAVVRIGRRSLTTTAHRAIAAAAFVAIFAFGVPFPLIILAAGLLGWSGARAGWPAFRSAGHDPSDPVDPPGQRPGTFVGAVVFLALWLAPVAALVLVLGPQHTLAQIATLFSQMAVVTFGGAYAVLAYVAQQAVQYYGWLAPGEMLDGLGLAETTPGPLIMVVQFVGFLAAFRDPGGLDQWTAAVIGACIASWVTFTPSFLWIFLGAPHVERLRGNATVSGALSAITAAVVGVILNLAVWFALHVVFAETRPWSSLGLSLDIPVWSTLDPAALVLAVGAAVAVFRFRLGMVTVLAAWAALGLAWATLGGTL
jgi:chromate transporter